MPKKKHTISEEERTKREAARVKTQRTSRKRLET